MKKLNMLYVFLIACVFLVPAALAVKAGLNQQQFISRINATNDTSEITDLVQHYPCFVLGSMNRTLKKYLNYTLSGETDLAEAVLDKAMQLAQIFQKEFGKSVFLEQLQLYRNWTIHQKRLQLTGDSLIQAGVDFARKGQLPDALFRWRAAYQIFEQLQNKFYQPVPLKNIALAHRYLGHYPAAKDTLQRALELARQIENKDLEASLLRELGNLHHISGEPKKSLPCWEDALKIFEEMNNPLEIGITLNSIGIYYRGMGQPEQALEYYERALQFHRIAENETQEGTTLNNIGNLYLDYFGEYEKAREHFLKALEIKKKHQESYLFNPIVGNIGLCYQNQGNYTQALAKYFEALKLAQNIGKLDGIAEHLSDIGSVYLDIGMPAESIPYFREALDTLQRIGDKKQEIETLGHLGDAQKTLKDYPAAAQSYKRALKLARHGNFKAGITSLMRNLAEIAFKLERPQEAITHFKEALKLSQEIQDKRETGYLFLKIGEYYLVNTENEKALANFKKSLHIGQEIHDQELCWQSQYGVGTIRNSLGHHQLALDAYKKSIETIEKLRSQLKAVSFRENFLEEKLKVYHAIIRLLIKLERFEEGFEYLERSKSRCFLDILSTGWFDIAQGISPELLNEKKNLERKLNSTNQALFSEYAKPGAKQDSVKIQSLTSALNVTRKKYQELIQQIQQQNPDYAELLQVSPPVKISTFQQKFLAPNTALVEFLVGKDATYVWIVKKDELYCLKVPVNATNLEKMVRQLLQPFRDLKTGKIKNLANLDFNLKLSQEICTRLFSPLENKLNGIESLIIVPDDVLSYLPFELLVTDIERKPHDRKVLFSRYKNAHYLLEKFIISYTPSASVFIQTQEKAVVKPEKVAGMFGNPDFSLAREKLELTENYAFFNVFDYLFRSSRGWIFSELPGSGDEVRTISKILQPAESFTGSAASEENFKQKGDGFCIIHLATHAIIEEVQPMYSRIVFTQDQDPQEDGFVHTYEIFNLKLNADLVTLGACETGLGKFNRGEGLIGLTRAFIYAGAPSVVVSMWTVSDVNSGMMRNFYQNLKTGSPKSAALRNAKLTVLKTTGEFSDGQPFSFAHPFYWAAYVLIGNPDPVF